MAEARRENSRAVVVFPHPAQVVRTALVDAASVSSLITTSECVIVEAAEDKKMPMPSPDMGMY